jgi:preprotein translocase subunit SecF
MHIFKDTHYDFLRWRWHAVAVSWIVILAGLGMFAVKGIPKGLEFAGGTSLVAKFESPVSIEAVRDELSRHYPGGGGDAIVQTFGDAASNMVMVRVPEVGAEQGTSLSAKAQAVEAALRQGNLPKFTVEQTEVVGPAVGEELTTKGTWAMVLSLAGILAYIAFRFQFSFALGAVVATVHDLLVTFAFLVFFQYDLSLNVIAAILTVTGYSTNDTIVIFDRVRENMRSMRREALDDVINTALNQTLGRTVITAGTALLSALALFLFGGDVLHGFAFTMIVGIITGTYSSIFVAAAIVTFMRRYDKRATAATAAADTAGAGTAATRRSKPRKARAS